MSNKTTNELRSRRLLRLVYPLLLAIILAGTPPVADFANGSSRQSNRNLTPTDSQIEKQRQRLSSAEEEERRDALMRLGAMHLPAASRVALTGLTDPSPVIRAVAAHAILGLEAEESARNLIPLISDANEFVRREAAYALGLTHSRSATGPLCELLVNDKEDGVQGAAAVALGRIADDGAVVALAQVLLFASSPTVKGKSKVKAERNPFVLRAVATALGQIKSRAGVPALIAALTNEQFTNDVRREAAHALGLIGDPASVPALRIAIDAEDPYLARVAQESLRKMSH
jgi:HEAT repeat protein